MSSPQLKVSTINKVSNGTIKNVEGEDRIFYDGYWIRYYNVPDNLSYKKQLIDQLTRRVFHHTESGINTPGERLEEVRAAYEAEKDQARKRVLAAMLAGALMNRGSDILTHMVELEQMGVTVKSNNELIKECGRCFMGALEYGKYIRPATSKEGLDELWGEPFKAFTMSVNQFLETRYIKLSQAMREIDLIAEKLIAIFEKAPMFSRLVPVIKELAENAKLATETMRSDAQIIEVWPRFVGSADKIAAAIPDLPENYTRRETALGRRGMKLIQDGCSLIVNHATIRIPMPKSTKEFLHLCELFSEKYGSRIYGHTRKTHFSSK